MLVREGTKGKIQIIIINYYYYQLELSRRWRESGCCGNNTPPTSPVVVSLFYRYSYSYFFIFLFGLRCWRALWYFHVFYLFFLHIFLFFRFGLYRRFNGTEQMILKILKNPWPGKFAESLNPAYTSNIGFSIFRRRYIRKMSAHSTRVKWAEMFWKHLEQ